MKKKGRRKFVNRTTWVNQKKKKMRKTEFKDLLNCIVNMADIELSDDMKSLLIKGLNFCPTPIPDHESQTLTDILIFERRCRLKPHFLDRPEDTDRTRFTPTTGWTPLAGKSTGLDTFPTATKEEIMDQKLGEGHKNLTKGEMQALRELRDNTDIEIKPADKGGCIVIMSRKWYEEECMRQLKNRDHYMRTGNDQMPEVARRITQYLKECKKNGKLPECTVDWLIPKSPRTALFYILPKIHKKDTLGRPIISANECPTERISIFVDYYIRPLAKKVQEWHQAMRFCS